MWALRRASYPLNKFSTRATLLSYFKLEHGSNYFSKEVGICGHPQIVFDGCLSTGKFYHTAHASPCSSMGWRRLSSQAGAKSSGEEDNLEAGFSELESAEGDGDPAQAATLDDENEDDLISEPELSGDDDLEESAENELEISDAEVDFGEEKKRNRRGSVSALSVAILKAPGISIHSALDKWVSDGKEINREEILVAMLNLRKRRMYGRALQLSEWLEEKKHIDFASRDYASRLDLIAKVRGIHKAESYLNQIPESFRDEVIYRTLLANCTSVTNVKKAESVFNRMRDLNFPISVFACNQLLLLYKRVDKKKICDTLLMMEKENVKPTLFTYKLLIDTKGQANDINGMDQLLETMKSEGIKPDLSTLAIVARHYASAGMMDKAEAILKEMEGNNLHENRWACRILPRIYALLGKPDEVARIWKFCASNPRLEECVAAIEAFGRLKKVEEAEEVFDKMAKTYERLSSKHYSALLKVYANHKMLVKGKDLVRRMSNSNCRIGPLAWDALVKLYVEVGEVEKAESILQKASQQNYLKPMLSSYMMVMNQYAKRGDIHHTEKMFHRMRRAGYTARMQQFEALIQAYINAESPAYGIRERMMADNIFPNKGLAAKLAQVDAFRKTAVSDLLD